jgi:hypothetical protein
VHAKGSSHGATAPPPPPPCPHDALRVYGQRGGHPVDDHVTVWGRCADCKEYLVVTTYLSMNDTQRPDDVRPMTEVEKVQHLAYVSRFGRGNMHRRRRAGGQPS